MQTFLPYPDFIQSAACLDNKRLNKQIVEALQIYKANDLFKLGIKAGWQNHPAVKMWREYGNALLQYRHCCIEEWRKRGFKSHKEFIPAFSTDVIYPPWLGNEKLHISHQSNLLRKDPEYYRDCFDNIPNDLDYFWPV